MGMKWLVDKIFKGWNNGDEIMEIKWWGWNDGD